MNETTKHYLLTLSLTSPNLPYEEWSFVLNEDEDDVEIFNDYSRYGYKQTFVLVYPTGYPTIERRKLYVNALTNPEAKKILYNENGHIYTNARFGVFNKDGYLIVSDIEEEVNLGIALDLAQWDAKNKD
jgi:hypothetical protein